MTTIRHLTPADLEACLVLAVDRGWAPEREKWRLLLEDSEAYGIDDPAGGLAGTVLLTRYGAAVAFVGMMLVASYHGRQGLGRRLMTHAVQQATPATVVLYATDLGRPLYERLGFRVVGSVTKYAGRFRGAASERSRAAVEADLPAVVALDATAFGAPRADLIATYFERAEQFRVSERDGRLSGFAAASRNVANTMIGPVVADDLGTARELIADVAAGVDGPVRLELDERRHGLGSWAREHGLEPGDVNALMVHGDRPLPGDRARLIGPATLALG
jgi:GNAT superfamily N-acetyltransferase